MLLSEMRRLTARDYAIRINLLDPNSLHELERFIRDVTSEMDDARRARFQPWRYR
jgi:hypothetical protein